MHTFLRMCGIFGYVGNRENTASLVFDGLKSLEYRGYDSWGVAIVPSRDPKKIRVVKKIGKIGDANVDKMPKSTFGFGHTRWATHGGVTQKNAHPLLDCTKSIAIVHNGIFENYEEVKEKMVKLGHRFVSETDTEVTVHLIEEYAKKISFTKAVQKAFNDMEGLDAIIAMDLKNRQFVAVRNGSPLVVGYGDGENYIASDAAALIPYTRQVHFLEDDEMAIINNLDIQLFNVRTGDSLHPKKQHLDWTIAQVEKGEYPYFMLKEIYEQPGIIADIASNAPSQAEKLAKIIKDSDGTYMVACGTASYSCIAGMYLFSKIAKRQVSAAIGSEFGFHLDFLTPKSLVIALSQSGETMDTLEAVKKAKQKGAKIFALVNVLGSTLYRESDHKMLIGAGPEKSVASTKAFTGKLAHLILLSYALAGDTQAGQNILMSAAMSAKVVLGTQSVKRILTLAKQIKKAQHLYIIGRGLSYPASLEAALKIKEISYIHAEGFAAGELKHGVIALIEKGTPCLAFLPDDETYGANLAGAMEMKARGGYIIGVSHKTHGVFDYFIPVPDAQEATIIPNVIVAQLLAYYLAVEKGLDPDKPRNLAKSVTVK